MKSEIKHLAENILYAVNRNYNIYHEWLNSKKLLEQRYEDMEYYLNNVANNVDDMFRPMKPEDVQCGQMVFGKGDYGWYCHMIEEVYNPNDNWKAYCASDGCRYGLYETYILIEEED